MSETKEFAKLQDDLIDAIELDDAGVFDSNEVHEHGAAIFLFADDPEHLFQTIEPVLRHSSLGSHARVTVRNAGPGGSERVVQLQPEGRS